MPKGFLKSLFWALALHGGVLGILLFSWPFLAQSVFSFDQSRIIKVSLVSQDLSSPSFLKEPQKISSSGGVKNKKNPQPQTGSNPIVPEPIPFAGESPIPPAADQNEKKETGTGISSVPRVNQPENTSREKGHGGQNPSGGIGKELLVSFSSGERSGAGSSLAVPRYGQNREPYYPAAAREQGWQGTALLKVLVLKNGTVGSLEIKRSSGYSLLDRSALKAVKDWKFVPAQKDGQPIEIGVEIPVTFRLE
ncbi:MAG: energy transducer TonB [Deltaproteobacteria bacterium]|nr:energy transducer TonB [Deltaproteobacteria bacterium]